VTSDRMTGDRMTVDEGRPGPSMLYLIGQVELAARQQLEQVLSAENLTAVQYAALTVLERHPGMTSAALARRSFVRPQTKAEMVNVLVARGLVRREEDPDNRRQYLLSLTPEGQALLRRLLPSVTPIAQTMVVGLDAGQVELLTTYLARCRRALLERASAEIDRDHPSGPPIPGHDAVHAMESVVTGPPGQAGLAALPGAPHHNERS
jgi:DNA-binding MarR family transcriptional regulator